MSSWGEEIAPIALGTSTSWRRDGPARSDDARAAYDHALELVHSDPERRFLERRLAELHG